MLNERQIKARAEHIMARSPAFRKSLKTVRAKQKGLLLIEKSVRAKANNPMYAR